MSANQPGFTPMTSICAFDRIVGDNAVECAGWRFTRPLPWRALGCARGARRHSESEKMDATEEMEKGRSIGLETPPDGQTPNGE